MSIQLNLPANLSCHGISYVYLDCLYKVCCFPVDNRLRVGSRMILFLILCTPFDHRLSRFITQPRDRCRWPAVNYPSTYTSFPNRDMWKNSLLIVMRSVPKLSFYLVLTGAECYDPRAVSTKFHCREDVTKMSC